MFSANTEYVGIDTLIFEYEIASPGISTDSPLFEWNQMKVFRDSFGRYWTKGDIYFPNGAFAYIHVTGGGRTMRLTIHPSKLLHEHSDSKLCDPDLVSASVYWTIRALYSICHPSWAINPTTGEYMDDWKDWPHDWTSLVKLCRIDFARDIYCGGLDIGIETFENIEKKYGRSDSIYRNKMKKNTLSWGDSSRLRTSLYSKSDSPNHEVEPGWLRFECQAKSSYLREIGISSLADVNSVLIHSLLWERWKLSRLDTPFSMESERAALLDNMIRQESASTTVSFFGVACLASWGLPVPIAKRTLGAYRKLGRKYGFNIGDPLENMGSELYFINFGMGSVQKMEVQMDLGRHYQVQMSS
jgi:hypothetical protein